MKEPIEVSVDGQRVTGILDCGQWDLSVMITSPYEGFNSGLHIPFFARNHNPEGYFGEKGMTAALEILKTLHGWVRVFEEEKGRIKSSIENVVATMDKESCIAPSEVKERQIILRRQFKGGELNQKQYQVEKKRLSQSRINYTSTIYDAVEKVFVERGAKLSMDLYEQTAKKLGFEA